MLRSYFQYFLNLATDMAGIMCGLLLASLGLGLFFLLPVPPARAQALCTHWAAPQSSGSTCTQQTPCLIGTFLASPSLAQPGAVLCLQDGTYTGGQSMLALTGQANGTETQPITIRALNDGKVLIDGQYGGRPLDCLASYWTIQGVDLKNGNDSVMVLRGNTCVAQRVVAYSTDADLSHHLGTILDVGGQNNLCEDCVVFGYARKGIAVGSRGGSGPNTIRRSFTELNGFAATATSGHPTNPAEIGYDQDNVTMENVIAHREPLAAMTDPQTPHMVFSTHGSALLGSMAYIAGHEQLDVDTLLSVYPEGGSHAGSGHVTSTTRIQDFVAYAHPSYPNAKGFVIYGGSGSQGNVADNIVAIAPNSSSGCQGAGWACTHLKIGKTVSEATGGVSVWSSVPGVCKRYVNRQLTTQPLWPWPMNGRLKSAMVAAGRPALDLTAQVESLLGVIPPECTASGAGVVPPPGEKVQALVQWTDTTNTTQTGYKVHRQIRQANGAMSGYMVLEGTTTQAARSFTDIAPIRGTLNCYAVETLAAQGSSPLSSPDACADVPLEGNPIPPAAPQPVTDVTVTITTPPATRQMPGGRR